MELRLIRFMRNNPFMYDKKHNSYRDQILKDEKWTQLSQEIKVPVDVLKKRWKSLRDRFFRVRKTNTPYKYYSKLQFLENIEKPPKKTVYEIDKEALDDILTKSEDSFLLDQASFSSFDFNDTEALTPVATSENQDQTETIEEVYLTEPTSSGTQNQQTTPFKIFLESIALTVENAGFSMSKVMRLQMSILELVQNEMNNSVIDS